MVQEIDFFPFILCLLSTINYLAFFGLTDRVSFPFIFILFLTHAIAAAAIKKKAKKSVLWKENISGTSVKLFSCYFISDWDVNLFPLTTQEKLETRDSPERAWALLLLLDFNWKEISSRWLHFSILNSQCLFCIVRCLHSIRGNLLEQRQTFCSYIATFYSCKNNSYSEII